MTPAHDTPPTRKGSFGNYYLTLHAVVYACIAIGFTLNPGRLFSGNSYHVFTDFVPRWAWSLMWLTAAVTFLYARIKRTSNARHYALMMGMNAAATWTAGTTAALFIDPKSYAAGGPLFMVTIVGLHYGIARFIGTECTVFWGEAR